MHFCVTVSHDTCQAFACSNQITSCKETSPLFSKLDWRHNARRKPRQRLRIGNRIYHLERIRRGREVHGFGRTPCFGCAFGLAHSVCLVMNHITSSPVGIKRLYSKGRNPNSWEAPLPRCLIGLYCLRRMFGV